MAQATSATPPVEERPLLEAPPHLELGPEQIRMARGALGLNVRDLARLAEIHHNTIGAAERGGGSRGTLALLQQFFEARGVTFLDDDGSGPGIRLKPSSE